MLFRYVACNAQGVNTQGVIECDNEAAAESRLWDAGLIIVELRPARETRLPALLLPATWDAKLRPVLRQHIEALWEGLSLTLPSEPVVPDGAPPATLQPDLPLALHLLAEQASRPTYRSLLLSLAEHVSVGEPLSGALEARTGHVTAPELRLLRAGEQSGRLAGAVGQLALLARLKGESLEPLTRGLFRALLAPALALSGGGLAVWLLWPTTEAMASQGGGNLATDLLVHAVHGLQAWPWWTWLVLAAILVGLAVGSRTAPGREVLSAWAWWGPLWGPAVRGAELAGVCRWLRVLLDQGVPWVELLDLLPHTSGNIILQAALLQMRSDVLDGVPVETAVRGQHGLPESFSGLLSTSYGGEAPVNGRAVLQPTSESYPPLPDPAANPTRALWDAERLAILEDHYRRQALDGGTRAGGLLARLVLILTGAGLLWLLAVLLPVWRTILNT